VSRKSSAETGREVAETRASINNNSGVRRHRNLCIDVQSRGRPGGQVTRQQAFQLMKNDPRSVGDGKPVFRSVEKESYYDENAMASCRHRREPSMALELVEDATTSPLTAP
jgi:hypothetical protein